MDFSGKNVIVTGSTKGIGKTVAEEFLKANANVVISGTSDTIYTVENDFQKQGYKVKAVRGDISKAKTAQDLVNTAINEFGSIDILVNNAGITADMLLIKMKEEDWDRVMEVNLKGAFLCTKAVARPMMKQRHGFIVNISSVVGLMGNAGQCNYASSKAGLIGFTKSVARELAPRGINCNAVAPGFIETQMTEKLSDDIKASYLNEIPLRRFGTPLDVAHLVMFLSSETSKYITGQVISVDGGLYM